MFGYFLGEVDGVDPLEDFLVDVHGIVPGKWWSGIKTIRRLYLVLIFTVKLQHAESGTSYKVTRTRTK